MRPVLTQAICCCNIPKIYYEHTPKYSIYSSHNIIILTLNNKAIDTCYMINTC